VTDKDKGQTYRIIMFAPAFPPFANPEAIVNGKLALAFLDAGWHVDVITRNLSEEWTSYNFGSSWDDPWTLLKELTHIVEYKGALARHRWLDTMWSGFKTAWPIYGCRWSRHAVDLALSLHRRINYDVVLSRSLPDSAHLAALSFAEIVNIPWVANWNDGLVEMNPPPAGRGVGARLTFFRSRFMRATCTTAKWFTFPSERMRRYVSLCFGGKTLNRSSTIPHVALPACANKAMTGEKRNVFSLCYAGKIYVGRDPETFLSGLQLFLKRRGPQTKMCLNIIGLEEVGLTQLAAKYDVERQLNIVGPLSYGASLNMASQSDVLLSLEAPYTEGIFLPSKLVDYVQTGRPVLGISPRDSTVSDILSKHGGGVWADCTSIEGISDAIEELYDSWEKCELESRYGSARLFSLFSPEKVLDKYREVFSSIGINSHSY